MKHLMDALDKVNKIRDRMETMTEGSLSQGQLQLIYDHVEYINLIIDRRRKDRHE